MRSHYENKETIVTIIAENQEFIDIAIKEIKIRRKQIEEYIKTDDFFKITYEPYEYNGAEKIIENMCNSSLEFDTGPMSTVAGIIAEYALRAMINAGAKYAIIDNGGDIAVYTNKIVNIGVYTGNKNHKIAYEIKPTKEILGICTSSGKIGHSFNFGNADAVTVFSNNVALADAAATAIANLVNSERDISNALKILDKVKGIIGVIIFIDGKVGFWGKIPKIVTADVPINKITRGELRLVN